MPADVSMGFAPPLAGVIQEKAEAPPTGLDRVTTALGLVSAVGVVAEGAAVTADTALLTLRRTFSQRTVGGFGVDCPFDSKAEAAP